MGEAKVFIKAKDCAYRLLSYRPRSVKEMSERLKKKGFTPGIIKKTVKYLSEINYLNDEDFAKTWVRTRLQLRPVGLALLRYQLRQKGVSSQTIEKAFADCASQYDECKAASELALSRRKCYRGLDVQRVKRRLYQYLRRRGFTQEAILEAINSS